MDFLNNTIGEYVDILTYDFPIDETTVESDYENIALNLFHKVYANNVGYYASNCSLIESFELEHGGCLYTTETMMEYASSLFIYTDILEPLTFLFNPILKYLRINSPIFVKFKELILDGLVKQCKNFGDIDNGSRWDVDWYAILQKYIKDLRFTEG